MANKSLGYIVKKFFLGEQGIVEKVEGLKTDGISEHSISSYKDDFGYLPQIVTFRNPLGQLLTRTAYSYERVHVKKTGKSHPEFAFRYKIYKIGGKFP